MKYLINWVKNAFRCCSQTTFTRGGDVVQKCPLFVNVHKAENVNIGGQKGGQKKAKIL